MISRHVVGDAFFEEGGNLRPQFGAHFLVGIDIQDPVLAAKCFSKHLLRAVTGPGAEVGFGAQRLTHLDGVIVAAAVDDMYLVHPVAHAADDRRQAIGLVAGNDEYRNRQFYHGNVTVFLRRHLSGRPQCSGQPRISQASCRRWINNFSRSLAYRPRVSMVASKLVMVLSSRRARRLNTSSAATGLDMVFR